MKQKVCIVGDGLTGLTAALFLSKLNIDIHLIAPNFEKKFKDNRTTALSRSNYNFLIKFLGEKNSKLFWPSSKINLYHQNQNANQNFMTFEDNGKNLLYVVENNKIKNLFKTMLKKKIMLKFLKKK